MVLIIFFKSTTSSLVNRLGLLMTLHIKPTMLQR